jgi:hypothetical protein
MRDYWLTQYLLAAVGWFYLALALLAVALALWLPKGRKAKTIAVLLVLALASILPIQGYQGYLDEKKASDDYKLRFAKAKALFDERCKTAGEKIYRTVDGVESVLLIKSRSEKINFSDQYALDDPYGSDFYGDDYAASFLWEKKEKTEWVGYKFVVLKNNTDASLTRFSLGAKKQNDEPEVLKNITSTIPQFGVNYEDVSTLKDRDNWIAGSKLQVIQTQTGEVLGERIGWMFDSGLGSTSGGRSLGLCCLQRLSIVPETT